MMRSPFARAPQPAPISIDRIPAERFHNNQTHNRNCVKMLQATEEYQQFQRAKEVEGAAGALWIWATLAMLLVAYVDAMIGLTSSKPPIGSTVAMVPAVGRWLANFLLLVPVAWSLLAPWCQPHVPLWRPVLTYGIVFAAYLAVPYVPFVHPKTADAPPFLYAAAGYHVRKVAPMLGTAVVGLLCWSDFSSFWKGRSIHSVAALYLVLAPLGAVITVLVWVYGSEYMDNNAFRTPLVDLANNFLPRHYDRENVWFANLYYSMFCYAAAVLTSHVVLTPFLLRVVLPVAFSPMHLLPTSPIGWVLSMMALCVGGCVTYVNHMLTIDVGVGLGVAALLLLWNGFE